MKITRRQLKFLINESLNGGELNEIGPILKLIGKGLKWFWGTEVRKFLSRMAWSLDGIGISQMWFMTPADTRVYEVFDNVIGIDRRISTDIVEQLSSDDKTWIILLHPDLKQKKLGIEQEDNIKNKVIAVFDRLNRDNKIDVKDYTIIKKIIKNIRLSEE